MLTISEQNINKYKPEKKVKIAFSHSDYEAEKDKHGQRDLEISQDQRDYISGKRTFSLI